ncbi:hypothetical protein [Catenulispora pinistramenti]|uniref:hypothetical protein n=1 Tax=Catenulispora pinistramenti TaxID=2705254 RepID=UPI0034D488A5
MVNGTSVTAAAAALALARLRRSYDSALTLSACLTDLLGAAPAFLAPQLLASTTVEAKTVYIGSQNNHGSGTFVGGDNYGGIHTAADKP